MTGELLCLFLSGDVMTGRGIDQIQATPGDPTLYESWAKSAIRYVEIAERSHGAIPRRVKPEYVWGNALAVLGAAGVDARAGRSGNAMMIAAGSLGCRANGLEPFRRFAGDAPCLGRNALPILAL